MIRVPAAIVSRKARLLRWLRTTLIISVLPIWTVVAVFVIGGMLAGIILYGSAAQLGASVDPDAAVIQTTMSLLVYVIGMGILLIEPYAIRRLSRHATATLLGVARRPMRRDIAMTFLAWAGYFMLTAATFVVISLIVPTIDDQAQQIGFSTEGPLLDKLFAFVVIVVAAPIVEEIVFRGYLYGSLRRHVPWWLAAGMASALFGVVHGQWNVGIDVAILSMIACYLRERTGAIWSGIGLHMLKNSIAYYLLFWAPPWAMRMLSGT